MVNGDIAEMTLSDPESPHFLYFVQKLSYF